MAVDVIGEAFNEVEGEFHSKYGIENLSKPYSVEPNLALIDYSDGIWVCDHFTSTCAAIKERYIRTNKRLEKFTSADILACIKFEDTGEDEIKRKKKKNRRVRFSTGMSISVDSLLQCNSETQPDKRETNKQTEPVDNSERFFYEAEFICLPPHRHLTTGENKVYNAFYEDAKTVGYGRNPYSHYNNPFDPRLKFTGLQNELNISAVTDVYDKPYTDTFNCALTLQNPTDFVNTYLNLYRAYLGDLDAEVSVVKKTVVVATDESDSSINLQEASDISEDENRLIEKLESVRHLWPSDELKPNSPVGHKCLTHAAKEETHSKEVSKIGPKEVNKDIPFEKNGEIVSTSHLELDGCETLQKTPVPIIQQATANPYVDERLIVHTTCLSSDGQSTETLTHETILKKPAAVATHNRYPSSTIIDDRNALQQLVGNRESPVEIHDEDDDDDSDNTLTPGEEDVDAVGDDIDATEIYTEPRITYKNEPANTRDENAKDDSTGAVDTEDKHILTATDAQITRTHEHASGEGLKEIGVEQKGRTKLNATTEPFVPTSQRRILQKPPPSNVVTTSNNVTVAKQQTTGPTSNEPIYQTSDIFPRPPAPRPTTKDVPKEPSLFWYTYQFPSQRSHVEDHQVQQQPCQRSHVEDHQVQQQPPQYHTGSHHVQQQQHVQSTVQHTPQEISNIQDQQTSQQPQSKPSVQTGFVNMPPRISHDHTSHRFLPRVHAPGYQHYQQRLAQGHQRTGQGHHIPVHSTSRFPSSADNSKGSNRNTQTGTCPPHSGSQYGHQTNFLQGQSSNQQPVYNSFWLQFQNMVSSNIQRAMQLQPLQHNTMPNPATSGLTVRHNAQPSQELNATVDLNRLPSITNPVPQTPTRCDSSHDTRFVTPQIARAPTSHHFKPNTGGQSFNNMPTPRFLPNAGLSSHLNGPRICDDNANNNADTTVEIDASPCEAETIDEGEAESESCIIGVLESSRSRNNYRAVKKTSKKLRPIRSCLVQVV